MTKSPSSDAAGALYPSPLSGPFSLTDVDAYRRWRDVKLASHSRTIADLLVEVRDLAEPTESEKKAILDRCQRTNMAVYACHGRCLDESDVRPDLKRFAALFGLGLVEDHRSAGEDGIVALEVADTGGRAGFIPYTTKPLNWHTDGYYRGPEDRIRAMVLHCVRPAHEGGVNGLMDPEIAYIRLRDRNPAHIAALMHPDAMTIPAFEEEGRLRPEGRGPVFCVEPDTGNLYMRYTARKRNVVWRDDATTAAAVTALTEVLADEADPFRFHHRLEAGMGLLCNNVLHDRTGFVNDPGRSAGRLYYRARYGERIAGT
ncbi:MAG: TauD/TfdA family dioxygenase [Hyphomicrobiales bacterium]|nr:TauD/TfdA family dioxygenase [Hyphomicrobiales bacterium]